jgi:hypothetical protein
MEEKTFLYSVNPKRTIVGLSGVNSIRVAKSLYLTKEDVLKCLPKASVYRRFKDMNVRVTIGNIDRLHRAEFVSEEDWPKVKANDIIEEKSEGHGKVVVGSDQEEAVEVAELTSVSSDEKEEVATEETPVDDIVSSEAVIAGGNEEGTDLISEEDLEPETEVQTEAETYEEESDDTLEDLDEQDHDDQQNASQRNTVYTGKKKNKKNR